MSNQIQSHKDLLLCFLRDSILLALTFKCLIHFALIFVQSSKEKSNFILLHMAIQLSQHHMYSFSNEWPWNPCQNQQTGM